jgi:hypothetical protein
LSASCCHVVGDALGIHVPSTSHVGCCVGTLCQLACPSRRPSSSPPRSRWVVVGRSRTATRSHALRCGAGCLMTRARPSPTNASKTAATPRLSRALLFCLWPGFLLERAGSVSVADSLGRSRCEETARYRVAGGAASGGRLWRMGVGARRARLCFSPYTCARGFARVTTHGRLESTHWTRRVIFRPAATRPRRGRWSKSSTRRP